MNWFLVLQLIEWGIRLLMLVVILRRRLRPTTALAWLMIIFLIPEIGVILYLLFGDARLGRRRTKLHKEIVEASRQHNRMNRQTRHILRPRIAQVLEPVILQAEKIGGMSTLGGNDVELLGDTTGLIDRIIEDIDQAKHHVHMMFYIYADDETGRRVSAALMRAAHRGVQVRLLVDGAGSWKFTRCGAIGELREHGVRVEIMLPIRLWRRGLARIDLRNHRKLVVIDGRIAYTGSHNVVNPDYGKGAFGSALAWVDLTGRFTGPIVHQLQIVFLEDWAFEMGEQLDDEEMMERVRETTGADLDDPAQREAIVEKYLPQFEATGKVVGQTVPTGPSEEDNELLPNTMLAALYAARERILITTPYFVPDEPTLVALLMAATRGVRVELIVPARSDMPLVDLAARFYFDPLLRAGIRIHEFAGGLLHSKTLTVDDDIALLGSTNMDIRSFYLNFELNVLMYGKTITARLRQAQTSYLDACTEVTLQKWRNRPRFKRFLSSAAALLSPLL